ncbi:uncharacterized protein PGTG_19757 [Puccinia graminis f. sp. tritici CRL 75-36-700-3]|uniref:Uncharacterized protein n=1 Tax=Puccinia graminis f. sp. tritici (strain CRL 75-36-700-3 / race SCCL) TaxID=418459 RepID=E3LBD5_PUCGT|nr:uncharacterized protein PGTG_19757 [Puccinia graminis f. sp. tritici CRL 75-36-700-3]EFP93860.2 hypothetical protein PGTG_19757 [Puccinia graminis f. sp. tritici CRL 75-36-700-3]
MSSRYSTPDYTLDDMRSEPLIGYDYVQNGIRYYPDRDQWSPAWEPEPSQASQPSPNDMVVDPPVIEEAKPNTGTANGSNGKAPIDPVLSNNLFRSTSTGPMEKIVIPKGMEIVETPGYYYPLKAKWHFVYDPQERYDLSSIPAAVPRELPPGLPIPFLKTTAPIDFSSNSSSPAPSSQSSSAPSTSSNTSSTASSAYPPISAYIGLNHQGVQRLLLDDNNPPSAVCIYTEEDVMRIFEGIAPDYK